MAYFFPYHTPCRPGNASRPQRHELLALNKCEKVSYGGAHRLFRPLLSHRTGFSSAPKKHRTSSMAPGQMVLAGGAFTTFLSKMATMSASFRSQRRRSKRMSPLRSASRLNEMDHAFLSLTATGERSLPKQERIRLSPVWCTSLPTCQMLERMRPTRESFFQVISASLLQIKKTTDGFTYLDPAQFHEYFAADLSAEQAAFMARSQVLNAAENFKAVITTPAWRSKPSWMLVAARDRIINPDLQRWYAERAKSHVVEVQGASHSVYVSRPREVAALIEEAASHAK